MTTTAENPIFQIEKNYGQSIWMDNLSRTLIESGELKELIQTRGICGITSNPAIFEKAIAGNAIYDTDIEAGIRAEKSVMEIYESLVFEDISNACDIFKPVYDETNGLDGYVSIEVPPTIAKDTQSTISEAQRYYQAIGRENVMIKIPGTPEGLPAVEQAISEGINVNVTLLFSVESYVETFWAYIRGLEKRAAEGKDISKIASVASFFLSRIDSKVDAKLEEKSAASDDPNLTAKLKGIEGKVAIANAKIAYQKYKEIIQSDRWKALSAKGAQVQRLLWASTSTKNPAYSDVMYVDELIGPNTVNTLPPNTIEACADHCSPESRIETGVEEAYQTINSLNDPDVNINLSQVMDELLDEGIVKFVKPFDSLISSLESKVKLLATV
ncbi:MULTISPECIES: transaldolase [Moorena]|uniref:Transaldolase n=1 Tax=Moorena producens 3L TaxID=489825 RepID=F4XYH4_9CYAN|nr:MULTISPECIES: transaldolase [Moorena]EGJ30387.1 transaldolase [Moorena producens 3L]NEP32495.1 transaldolase [Moorena sp. SIO3B2]NEP68100.1 transaldolase [Moorena sp. SIO3A5]NEQ07573.1 transaldolase [Moorena sp. SIO4E2]NER89976.1 transaldolase [Moorena sp. SIO3A2]